MNNKSEAEILSDGVYQWNSLRPNSSPSRWIRLVALLLTATP